MKVDCRSVMGEEETMGDGSEGVEVDGKNELRVVRFEAGSLVEGGADRFDIRGKSAGRVGGRRRGRLEAAD